MDTSARLFLLWDVNFLINGDQSGFKRKEQGDKAGIDNEISVNLFVTRAIPWFEKRSFVEKCQYLVQMEEANKNNLPDLGHHILSNLVL